MSGRSPLSADQIESQLASLEGWELKDAKLHREFQFADFSAAFAFMTRAAMISEQLNHHPEWFNVWNRVSIDLSTHDAGGVTETDFEWAKQVNALA